MHIVGLLMAKPAELKVAKVSWIDGHHWYPNMRHMRPPNTTTTNRWEQHGGGMVAFIQVGIFLSTQYLEIEHCEGIE